MEGNDWSSWFADCTFAYEVFTKRRIFDGVKDCIYLQGVYGSLGMSEQLLRGIFKRLESWYCRSYEG